MAGTLDDDIVPGAALDQLIDDVAAAIDIIPIIAGTAPKCICADAAIQRVISGVTVQLVVIGVAHEDVVARSAMHAVVAVEGNFSFALLNKYQVKGLIEDLILEGVTGSENIGGTGNNLDNLIVGNNGNNFLSGLAGDDEMHGGDGNDTVIGGDGLDTLFGGNGDDHYQYYGDEFISESDTAGRDTIFAYVDIDLEEYFYDSVEDDETPIFEGQFEIISLGPSRDLDASGDLFDNTLNGNSYKNKLNGRSGVDFLNGYAGNDTLTGGADNDRFYFSTALNTGNVDTITDMVHLADKIYIDDAIFKGTFNTGLTMNAGLFRLNAAGDSNDRIIYKKTTGELFYDSNGSGTGGLVKFAVLTTKPTLTAEDFVVF